MTRNTVLRKIKFDNQVVVYRDLTVLELTHLDNIKNEATKFERAAQLAIVERPNVSLPWNILFQIGQKAIAHSTKYVNDRDLFEITVKDIRRQFSESDSPLILIGKILEAFPGQSIVELQNLTHKDLIELGCLVESMTQRPIFKVKGAPTRKKGASLVNPSEFADDGKSLQEKMTELNNALGGIPK